MMITMTTMTAIATLSPAAAIIVKRLFIIRNRKFNIIPHHPRSIIITRNRRQTITHHIRGQMHIMISFLHKVKRVALLVVF